MSDLTASGDEFREDLEKALRRPGGLLFTMRIEAGDGSDGAATRVRGYADLAAGDVLWQQDDDSDDRSIVSALIKGELRFGIGLPQTEGLDPLPATPVDTALGMLFWLRAADSCARRGSLWDLTLDPAHPSVADGLLSGTAEALTRRGERLRATACFGDDGQFIAVSVDAMMPPVTDPASADEWSRWHTRIDFTGTPEIPGGQLETATGRDEVWRRLSSWSQMGTRGAPCS